MTFQVQIHIYWKDQKTERLKKIQSFFILKTSNNVHYISTLKACVRYFLKIHYTSGLIT